jgi:hypothetical protein
MWRDSSRERLPTGAVWNLQDYIPDEGGSLRKRGGWEYHGSALTTLNANSTAPATVLVAPFSGGTQVLATAFDTSDDDVRLFDLTAGADRGDLFVLGSGLIRHAPGIFYRELAIFPAYFEDSNGNFTTGTPRKYSGAGAPADLTGSPPNTRFFAVYKDRLVAASANTSFANRLYFSGAGNAESWDTTNRYLDLSHPPVGLAPLRNALVAFHAGSVERIRGAIPPGSAAANMELEPLFNDVGLANAEALTVSDDTAYWADENGVYRTDGTSLADLTKQGGISAYWRDQFASADHVAIVVWRGHLLCSLTTGSTYVDFLVLNIDKRAWFRFTNIMAWEFAVQYGAADQLYFANRDSSSKRVGKLSGIFAPAAGVKNDADGDAVAPVLETGLYDLNSDAIKRWKQVYVSHDIRDAASDNPTLTVSYLTDPATTNYTTLSPTLPETTKRERKRLNIGSPLVEAMAFKIAQTNASSDTRLSSIAAVVEAKEGSRLRAA